MATATVFGARGAAPTGSAAGADRRALRWAGLAGQVLGRMYRGVLLTLLVAALLPALWSWSSFVVRSGSMEPAISVGDVVVAQPFAASEDVPLGRVVVFPNPAKPGSDELLVHRVVERLEDGRYATAGDASPSYDASPITSQDVDSRATILVPFVGRPLIWLAEGDVVPLVLWSVITAAAFALATGRIGRRRDEGPPEGPVAPPPGGRRHRGLPRRPAPGAAPVLALLVAGAFGVSGDHTATAAFTDSSSSPANTWTVSDTLAHRLALSSPGAAVRGSVPLTATLANGGGEPYVVRLEYAAAGTTGWQAICTDSSAPYSCAWVTTARANGPYDLRAVATLGETTLVSPVVKDVIVDNLAPTVAMSNPGTPLRGRVTFAATAADAHSGVARVVLQYALAGSSTWRDLGTDTSAPYSTEFDTTTLANGTYSVRAVATDKAGNSTTSAAIASRVVDNVTTSIVMNDPGAVLTGTVTVSATGSSTAGVASVRIQGTPDGSSVWSDVCVDTVSPYTCAYNTSYAPDGLYDLRAILTDGAGRTTTSAVVEDRRVDNTQPRASDVQTTNGTVAGRLDTGDTLALTYSEQMRLGSISTGWDGSPVTVSLRLRDGNLLGLGSKGDTVDVLRAGAPVNLGSVNLREDYISSFGTAQLAATMTASTVTINGVVVTRVLITAGTQTSGPALRTVTIGSSMTWAPSDLSTDAGGLRTSTIAVLESGTIDRQF